MQNKKQKLLSGFYGRFVTGYFTKQDGSHRPIWGVIKNDTKVQDHLVVVYDMHLKAYRRLNINKPMQIRTGNKVTTNEKGAA